MKVKIKCNTCGEERIDEAVDTYTGLSYLASELVFTCATCGYETIEITPLPKEESEKFAITEYSDDELADAIFSQGISWKEFDND